MRKKYVIMRLLCAFIGYFSIGLTISMLILTIVGNGSLTTSLILLGGLGLTLIAFLVEQGYQRKVDQLDYEELHK